MVIFSVFCFVLCLGFVLWLWSRIRGELEFWFSFDKSCFILCLVAEIMKWNYWILCIFLHFSSAIKVKLKDLLFFFFFFLILNFNLQFSWTINFSVLGFCDFAVEAWVQNLLEELGIEEAKSRCRGRPLLCITRWTVFVWLCSFVLYCNSISFWWDSHSLFCVYYVVIALNWFVMIIIWTR